METQVEAVTAGDPNYHARFHLSHFHLNSVFGDEWFLLKVRDLFSIGKGKK